MADQTVARFTVAADHPCLAGHFPGNPIVPGVLILDEIGTGLADAGFRITRIVRVKFQSLLRPEEHCEIRLRSSDGSARFECRVGERVIASGALELEPRLD